MTIKRTIGRAARALLAGAGVLFILAMVIAFVGVPSFITSWVTLRFEPDAAAPRYIVVLGGGGIPSESGLMRTYWGAQVGAGFPDATFIVALPASNDPDTNSVGRMRDELVLRGIPRERVLLESKGVSTHEQAVNVRGMIPPADLDQPLMIITSHFHMKRAVLCFRKAGFTHVIGLPAAELGPEAYLGEYIPLRYGIWANLHAEVEISRELVALAFYKLRGWI